MKILRERLLSIMLASLVVVLAVVPAFAATNQNTASKNLVSKITKRTLYIGLWKDGLEPQSDTSEIKYNWDFKRHNVNISEISESVDFLGLVDTKNFSSSDAFLARLGTGDVMGIVNMFDQNLDLMFCSSSLIQNGEIRHINGGEFNFYSLKGKLRKYICDGRTVSYKYDSQGRLTEIDHDKCKDTFTYDKNGKIKSFVFEDFVDYGPMKFNYAVTRRNADGTIRELNDFEQYWYQDGTLYKLDAGDVRNLISIEEGKINSYSCESDSHLEIWNLSYSTF